MGSTQVIIQFGQLRVVTVFRERVIEQSQEYPSEISIERAAAGHRAANTR